MYVHPNREEAMSSPELRHMKLIIFQAEKKWLVKHHFNPLSLMTRRSVRVTTLLPAQKKILVFLLSRTTQNPLDHIMWIDDSLGEAPNRGHSVSPLSQSSLKSWFCGSTSTLERHASAWLRKVLKPRGEEKQRENKGGNVGATRRSQLACRLHRWSCSAAPGCMRAEQQFVNGASSPEKQRVSKSGGVGMKERREEGWKQFENLLAEARGRKRHLYAGLNFGTLAFCD